MNNNQQIVGKRVHHEILSSKYVYFSDKNLGRTRIGNWVKNNFHLTLSPSLLSDYKLMFEVWTNDLLLYHI